MLIICSLCRWIMTYDYECCLRDTMKHVRKEKELLWLVLTLLLYVKEIDLSEQTIHCPSQCICSKVRSRPTVVFRLKCGGGDRKVSSVDELHLQDFPLDIIYLWVGSSFSITRRNVKHSKQPSPHDLTFFFNLRIPAH